MPELPPEQTPGDSYERARQSGKHHRCPECGEYCYPLRNERDELEARVQELEEAHEGLRTAFIGALVGTGRSRSSAAGRSRSSAEKVVDGIIADLRARSQPPAHEQQR